MLTQLTNELYAVGVPLEAKDFSITEYNWIMTIGYTSNEGFKSIKIPEALYQILGTCTENDIDFDVEPYVHCISRPLLIYRDYKHNSPYLNDQCEGYNNSFRSLIASKGIKEFEKLVILKKV